MTSKQFLEMLDTTIFYYSDKLIAKFYDKLYHHTDDVTYYSTEIGKHKSTSKILVVGCGTGRILMPFIQKGFSVQGIDSSHEMISILQEKLEPEYFDNNIFLGDMKTFDLNERYDVIIIPFRTFSYNLSQEHQLITLKNIYKHLTEDGILLLDIVYPVAVNLVKYINKRRLARNFEINGKYVEYYENTTIDYLNQLLFIDTEFIINSKQANIKSNRRIVKYIYPSELSLLAKQTGFNKIQFCEGFSGKEINNKSKNIVAKIWKS